MNKGRSTKFQEEKMFHKKTKVFKLAKYEFVTKPDIYNLF